MAEDLVLSWVHPGQVHAAFMDSVLRTIVYDRTTGGGRIAGWNGAQCSANVSAGRNALVEWFLDTDATWLAMLDTDMVWQPDSLHGLLAAAEEKSATIAGGLCFAQQADTGQIWPTLYDLAGTEDKPEFVRYDAWEPNTLFPVLGTGAAFLLIHRSAAEAVRDKAASRAYTWFQETELNGMRIGEDMTFCMRAAAVGHPTYVHTGIHIGHLKERVIVMEDYLHWRFRAASWATSEAEQEARS